MTLTPEEMRKKRPVNRERVDAYKEEMAETEPYTSTTEEVRHKWAFEEGDVYESAAEFDRWFLQEIEKAEYSGYLRAVREQNDDAEEVRFGSVPLPRPRPANYIEREED